MASVALRLSKDSFIPLMPTGFEEGTETTSSHLRNINNIEDNRLKRLKRKQVNNCVKETNPSLPWMKHDLYSPGVVGSSLADVCKKGVKCGGDAKSIEFAWQRLHEEINDFYQTLSLTREEKEIRSRVIGHIKTIVHSLWPQAKVEVFGSSRTGLCLPTSDIDIVVTGKWEHLPLNTLKTALIRNGIKDEDIHILSTASVPLVRLVHSFTKVKIDISFNVRNGVKSAKMIKDFTKSFPALPKLVLVLKQFLVYRGLNEVYHGGMSSYALTILVISFLQGHHRPKSLVVTNLGMLLIEFFELYGINFNYQNVTVNINDGGSYRPKGKPWESYLSIVDPFCEGNDVAKGTYMIYQIKTTFENAYNTLHKAVTEFYELNRSSSLLRLILDVEQDVIQRRQWLCDNYVELLKTFPSRHESDSENSSEHSEITEISSRAMASPNKKMMVSANAKNKSRTVYNHSPTESLRTEFENSLEKVCSPHKNVMYAKQEWRSAQNRNRAPFNARDSGRYRRNNTAQMSKNCDR